MRDVTVYALLDPRDGAVRYVGRSVAPATRLVAHVGEAWVADGSSQWTRPSPKDSWVRELLAVGLRPELVELESVPAGDAVVAEQAWMDACRESGDVLANVARACAGVPHA